MNKQLSLLSENLLKEKIISIDIFLFCDWKGEDSLLSENLLKEKIISTNIFFAVFQLIAE
ncbi:putative inner membrane protein [Salmonella enterica subsp. enterica serovar Agona str. 69.H.06]|nr:putative inner membrane protein [Salmonella enterica subsp. enterica serovar Agona str. 69.H.06]